MSADAFLPLGIGVAVQMISVLLELMFNNSNLCKKIEIEFLFRINVN
ncbi:hypothetical protein X474_16045 [Dethiosulfatarculus sandiegensis]|uniref:Uncharacterized protein n=1 Tax=Dethiosulfatarculus sandiegensis TaxID=1429043 RepID=A0A0D2JUB8_9BACT|nr:hypothetical protein X474_16045 [Dethiosulfatarculus sandiegensis]